MITNRQKIMMILLSCKAMFLGIGFSLCFKITHNDSWISALLGSVLGVLFACFIEYILKKRKKESLKDLLNNYSFIGIIIRFLLLFFSILIIIELFFSLQLFARTFFLINSNAFLILLPLFILVTFIGFKGYYLIARVIECIFPIALSLTIFGALVLFFKADFTELKPFINQDNIELLKSGLYYFVFSSTPLLFLLDMDFEEKSISKYYIIASILITCIMIIIIGVLGQFLITAYRFPEYMVLKDIHLFNFIEKIENIVSICWIIDDFALLSIASCFLKRMLPNKFNNYSYLLIMFIIFLAECFIFGYNYIDDLKIFLNYPWIILSCTIPIFVILTISIKIKKIIN